MKKLSSYFPSFLLIASFGLLIISVNAKESTHEEVEFESLDGLKITADVTLSSDDQTKPFIILCHQAGWSRGEYREIAPQLNKLGFNCMAIDQRSGGSVNKVKNLTAANAKAAQKGQDYVDAEQDIVAAVNYAKKNLSKGKLIIWGSSYSSALVLRIASEHSDEVDGVLSFAPGEYFKSQGKPADWITTSVKNIKCPVFITSAKNEAKNWAGIYEAIPTETKVKFLPTSKGNHGSRALWEEFSDSPQYWKATKSFLAQFL